MNEFLLFAPDASYVIISNQYHPHTKFLNYPLQPNLIALISQQKKAIFVNNDTKTFLCNMMAILTADCPVTCIILLTYHQSENDACPYKVYLVSSRHWSAFWVTAGKSFRFLKKAASFNRPRRCTLAR